MHDRLRFFAGLCLICALGLSAYLYRAKLRTSAPAPQAVVTSNPEPKAIRSQMIFFRYNGLDQHYGHLATVDGSDLDHVRFVETLSCDVVHFAAGQGICLSAERGVLTTYAARLFDSTFTTRFTIPLHGPPSRTRVSPDGKLAALTVFITGHSYASVDFSTETLLVDTTTGGILANLEDFKVSENGREVQSPDFNFWGVTFTPDSRNFYGTLSTNGKHLLVKGDVATRTASIIHENVECPSLSPDGTLIAYKKRSVVDGRIVWQLQTLNLATMKETALAEKRSIDDQLEWLDNDHVLYSVSENPNGSSASTDVWVADAAGAASPRPFLLKAYSPAVVR